MYAQQILKKIAIYIGIFLVAIYTIYRLYPYLLGPQIEIYEPKNGDQIASSTFKVSGKAIHSTHVKIFDKEIELNENGEFEDMLVLNPPYTILNITATDKTGRETKKEILVSKIESSKIINE